MSQEEQHGGPQGEPKLLAPDSSLLPSSGKTPAIISFSTLSSARIGAEMLLLHGTAWCFGLQFYGGRHKQDLFLPHIHPPLKLRDEGNPQHLTLC